VSNAITLFTGIEVLVTSRLAVRPAQLGLAERRLSQYRGRRFALHVILSHVVIQSAAKALHLISRTRGTRMSAAAVPFGRRDSFTAIRLLRAGLLVGVSDACFAMVTNAVMRGSGAARVWQGVASVLVGKEALNGGAAMTALGVLMHFTVAFTWSALFLVAVLRSPKIRAVLDSEYGALKVAAVLGPFIWLVMSLVVIPMFVHRMPTLTSYWVVMLVGHIFFVGLPMAAAIGSGQR
jgi:hypothetical protein